MILPKVRDPRLVKISRGGTLTDDDHRLLALWAADCAEHVLELFESEVANDPRPRAALTAIRGWVRGEVAMMDSRAAGGHAMGAARPLRGAPRFAAYAAGQAACVAHVPEHDLGAAAYAIKATVMAVPEAQRESVRRMERNWQHTQIPETLLELVLEDQARRNDICWHVFLDEA
ncbi:putative immunity protein [Corynebacterium sp. A21]|uniref:putative immunity protein n=1 Tax=Corynebacterium sp. A21 TaxID=3457318 RepID=UPI003FD3076B